MLSRLEVSFGSKASPSATDGRRSMSATSPLATEIAGALQFCVCPRLSAVECRRRNGRDVPCDRRLPTPWAVSGSELDSLGFPKTPPARAGLGKAGRGVADSASAFQGWAADLIPALHGDANHAPALRKACRFIPKNVKINTIRRLSKYRCLAVTQSQQRPSRAEDDAL
jgi:hypothetical protein